MAPYIVVLHHVVDQGHLLNSSFLLAFGILFLEVALSVASAISYLLAVTTLDPLVAPAFPSPCLLYLGIKRFL